MGIFDFLQPDESEAWSPETARSLLLDLWNLSLNRVALGAPGTELSQFGQPSNRKPFKNRSFHYKQSGFVVELKDSLVHYFGFPIRKMQSDEVGPCEVSVVFPDGAEIRVTDQTITETLLPHLPSPTDTDIDEEETVYTFEINEHQLELEVSPEGHVCRLNLFSE